MLKRLFRWLFGPKNTEIVVCGSTLDHQPRPHPENSAGPFYVDDGYCIFCAAPHAEAPTLIGWIKDGPHHCIFRKQPETADEIDQALNAMCVSCVCALRYSGDDPNILERLKARGMSHLCDRLTPRSSA